MWASTITPATFSCAGSANLSVAARKSNPSIVDGAQATGVVATNPSLATDLLADPLCVMDVHGRQLRNCTCANDADAIGRIVSPLGKVMGVAMEACSGSADLGEELISRFGWNVSLGHATYIAKMKGSPDKSDWSDGRLIADLSRVGYVPLVWMPPAFIRDLRQLVNYRQQLARREQGQSTQTFSKPTHMGMATSQSSDRRLARFVSRFPLTGRRLS